MDKLILQPTTTAQWYSLINEAQVNIDTFLSEDIESYLVFLLMRFTGKPEMTHKVLAIDFLQSHHQAGSTRSTSLQEVADHCLLLTGLFPERAYKRRVKPSYYISLGQTAFLELADEDEYFAEHAHAFEDMISVLGSTRPDHQQTNQSFNVFKEQLSPDE